MVIQRWTADVHVQQQILDEPAQAATVGGPDDHNPVPFPVGLVPIGIRPAGQGFGHVARGAVTTGIREIRRIRRRGSWRNFA